jgi:RNA polymerase sigma factor (sigma-70 family)
MNIEEIYSQTFQYVYRYFYYKSVNPSDVEDLTHEVYIRFYQKYKEKYLSVYEAKRILYGYCKNIYKEWCRKSYKEKRADLIDNLVPYEDDFDEFEDDNYEEKLEDQRKQILQALEKLNSRTKYILESRFLRGMTRKEIADELGISEKDVHTYQKRGIKYLSKIINGGTDVIRSLAFPFF